MKTDLLYGPILAQVYTFPEHFEKLSYYAGMFLPFALGMAAFLLLGIWGAKRIWFQYFIQFRESRKAQQELFRDYTSTMDASYDQLCALNASYDQSLGIIKSRNEVIHRLEKKNTSLESDRNHFRENLHSRNDQLEALQKDLDTQTTSLNLELGTSAERIKELEAKLKSRETELAELERTNKKARKSLDKSESDQAEMLIRKEKEIDHVMALLDQEEKDTTTTIKSLNSKIETLTSDLEKEQKSNTTNKKHLNSEIEALKSKLTQEQKDRAATVKSLNSDNEQLGKQLHKANLTFKNEITDLTKFLTDRDGEIEALKLKNLKASQENSEATKQHTLALQLHQRESDNEVNRLNELVKTLNSEKDQLADDRSKREQRIRERELEISELVAQQETLGDQITAQDGELTEKNEEIERLLQELSDKEALTELYQELELALEAEKTKSTNSAISAFQNEAVVEDAKFGIVYTKKPEEIDDLKLISGVGKVLENTLHKFGVYRFQQIASWPENVVKEFVENLPFGDRVTRDEWIDQAAELHEKKYSKPVAF